MAAKPTKTTTRPTKAQPDAAGEDVAAEPAVRTKRAYNKKTPAEKLDVYYEDETGALTPMGSFKGGKPEEALETYFGSLEHEDQAAALEAATYVVNTPKGLVKLGLAQKLEIVKR